MSTMYGPPTTSHERQMAAGAYLVGIPLPVIGPVIFLLIDQQSAFVRRHSIRAMLEGGIYHILMVPAFFITFFAAVSSMPKTSTPRPSVPPGTFPPELFARLIIPFVIVGLLYLTHVVRAGWQAYRAYQGDNPTWNWPGVQ